MGRGWIGTRGQLLHFLRVVGCDRDEEGRPLVRGQIVAFLGIDQGDATETVVGEDAVYYRGGQPCPLAAGLQSTSYGTAVYVI